MTKDHTQPPQVRRVTASGMVVAALLLVSPASGIAQDAATDDGPEVTVEALIKSRDRAFPPLDPEDIIDAGGTGDLTDKDLTFAHLKDCGDGDPKTIAMSMTEIVERNSGQADGLDGMGWAQLGLSTPCPGLTGGMPIDLIDYCRGLSSPDVEWDVRRTASGRAYCWRHGRPLEDETPSILLAETGGGADFACLGGLKDSGILPTAYEEYKTFVVLYKYLIEKTQIECFTMKRDVLYRILIGEAPDLRFVRRRDGDYIEIEGDLATYGGPIFVELAYTDRQEEESFPVLLAWDDAESDATGGSAVTVTRTPEDATLYRSAAIHVEPWTPLGDSMAAIPIVEPEQPVVSP